MKNKSALMFASMAAAAASALAAPDLSKLPAASTKEGITYAKDIHPLFEASCLRCHGAERPKAGLHLDTLEGVLKGSKDGTVIEPGKSEKSQLVVAVARIDPHTAMPPMQRGGPRGGQGPQGGPPPNAGGGGNPPTHQDRPPGQGGGGPGG